MARLQFRNLNVTPEDTVDLWGVEGIATAIDRGGSEHWGRIQSAVEAEPYGKVALDLEQALDVTQSPSITKLMEDWLEYCREDDKKRFARSFRKWVIETGMSRAELAQYLGTSRSRLSSYESGAVTPSAVVVQKVRGIGEGRRRYLAP